MTVPTGTCLPPLSQAPVRPDLVIDWAIPAQRPGLHGAVARFFGPGQTKAEAVVQIFGFVVCAALLTGYLAMSLPSVAPALAWWQVLLVAVVGYDLIGGVLVNATGAAKRWYHRPGTRRGRLIFVAAHLVHLVVIAGLVLPSDWAWLAVNAGILLSGAAAIESVSLAIRRPLAAGWVVMAALLNLILVPLPAALAWFAPFFFLKLLVFHQVPEAPLASRVLLESHAELPHASAGSVAERHRRRHLADHAPPLVARIP